MDVKFVGTTKASTQSIDVKYKLTNNGTTAINLNNVKLRFYFTKEGTSSQNFFCDWSSVGLQYITGSFVSVSPAKTKANCYLEIGFTSGAGSLAAGQSAEVQARFAKSDWSNYDLTNDYSYKSTGTSFESWKYVTAYQSSTLVYGVEP